MPGEYVQAGSFQICIIQSGQKGSGTSRDRNASPAPTPTPTPISIDRSLKSLVGSCQFSTQEGSGYQRRAENGLPEKERAEYSSLSSEDHTVKKLILQQHIEACQAIGKSIQENVKQPALH